MTSNPHPRWGQTVRMVFERDPAVRSPLEVWLCYPGVHALILHRVAQWLYRHRLYFLARLLSHISRWLTGVEIHPGARIGERCFIDHGMGVVIGETAVIGNDVTIYQGVTLGGTGSIIGDRHPTIEDGVVIAAGATILGRITIGAKARIGAGAVVIKAVPPGATVVGVPGRVVALNGRSLRPTTAEDGRESVGPAPTQTGSPASRVNLQHADLPDPVGQSQANLEAKLADLERRLVQLERSSKPPSPEGSAVYRQNAGRRYNKAR